LEANYSGPLDNTCLLIPFKDYIRTSKDEADPTNYVINEDLKEDYDFKTVSPAMWTLLKKHFGQDEKLAVEIVRYGDSSKFSYFRTSYKIDFDSLKVLVLPPYTELETDKICSLEPKMLYINQGVTFKDLKLKIARYLNEKEEQDKYDEKDLRFWKPDFGYSMQRKMASYLDKAGFSKGSEFDFSKVGGASDSNP